MIANRSRSRRAISMRCSGLKRQFLILDLDDPAECARLLNRNATFPVPEVRVDTSDEGSVFDFRSLREPQNEVPVDHTAQRFVKASTFKEHGMAMAKGVQVDVIAFQAAVPIKVATAIARNNSPVVPHFGSCVAAGQIPTRHENRHSTQKMGCPYVISIQIGNEFARRLPEAGIPRCADPRCSPWIRRIRLSLGLRANARLLSALPSSTMISSKFR